MREFRARAQHRRVGAIDAFRRGRVGGEEISDRLFEVGIDMADRHLVVFEAQGHIPGARAGHCRYSGATQAGKVNIPQPAHIAAVGVFVVDDDHRIVPGGRERGKRQAEAHRILD